MTITSVRDDALELTIHTVVGSFAEGEIIGLIAEFNLSPTRFVIWDMTNADLNATTSLNVRSLVEEAKALFPNRPDGKTAVIAPLDIQYGLGRMSEAFAEITELQFELRVFRTEVEARQWLLGG